MEGTICNVVDIIYAMSMMINARLSIFGGDGYPSVKLSVSGSKIGFAA